MICAMRSVVLVITFVICLSAQKVQAQAALQSEPLYTRLDSVAAQEGVTAVQKTIVEENVNLRNLSICLLWLRNKSIAEDNTEPLYFLMYSDLLFYSARIFDRVRNSKDLYETSFLTLSLFEIMAITDAARCEDKSVMGTVSQLIANRFAAFRDVLPRLPEDSVKSAKTTALSYEEKRADRPPNSSICRSGLAAMIYALNDPAHTETKVHKPDQLGTTIIVGAREPYVPNFVTDETWQRLRGELRQKIQDRE